MRLPIKRVEYIGSWGSERGIVFVPIKGTNDNGGSKSRTFNNSNRIEVIKDGRSWYPAKYELKILEYHAFQKYDSFVNEDGMEFVVLKDLGTCVEAIQKGEPNKGTYVFSKDDILIPHLPTGECDNSQPTPMRTSKLQSLISDSYLTSEKQKQITDMAVRLSKVRDKLAKNIESLEESMEIVDRIYSEIEEEFEAPDSERMEELLNKAETILNGK